jgi:formylglycine-generating enzyme required for sulfatase activity
VAFVSWFDAARFANWLVNGQGDGGTETGSYTLAGAVSGATVARNVINGGYYIPTENEWYKAAYYNPGGSNYFVYATGSDLPPTPVASGTNAGSAVYNNAASVPAIVASAGGLSPYGTMGQGGNVAEWNESAFDGSNSSSSESRVRRGGTWASAESVLRSSQRTSGLPSNQNNLIGFRVASVPEPSTYALLLLGAGAVYCWKRRKRSL